MKIFGLLLIAAALSAQTPARRLVMISVDGLMPRTVRNAEKLGIRLPNLTEFRDKGAMSAGLRGVFPTVTYPSHTTMVTGRLPAEHGIVANTLFDPEQVMSGSWYWYSELIKVPTLWDVARQAKLTTAAVGWPVAVGARIDYNIPEYKVPQTLNDVLLRRAVATPGLVAEYEKARGPMKFEGEYFDNVLSSLAAFLIESHKPHLLLVHLVDLDHDQHGYGPESPEALRSLEKIDSAIGKIRNAVETAGVTAETRWIIVSDHGFFAVEKAFHPEAFLASLGLGASVSEPKSWRVATQSAGGSTAFILNNPNDTEAQALVLKHLKLLKEDGGYGIDRIVEKAELSRMQSWPNAFLALSMKEGWTNGSGRSGAWVTSSGKTKGTHGYAPGPENLDCTFIAFGPGVPARQLPRSELVNVAATAAELLGLSFPGTRGQSLLVPASNSSSR